MMTWRLLGWAKGSDVSFYSTQAAAFYNRLRCSFLAQVKLTGMLESSKDFSENDPKSLQEMSHATAEFM